MELSTVARVVALSAVTGLGIGCVQGGAPSADEGPDDVGISALDGEADAAGGDGTADTGCVPGSKRVCGTGKGTCEKGTQTCRRGVWGPCDGKVGPSTETCDGRDDDCDGDIDEAKTCECQPDETQKCGVGRGACEKGTQRCRAGSWGRCRGKVGPSMETATRSPLRADST
ncbi:MAG: hypothetical protein ABEL76_15695, partial [Bradymonadaceae bacterium]